MLLIDRAPVSPGAYIITDIEGSKVYIGSSKNLYRRRLEHISSLSKNKSSNSNLQAFYNEQTDPRELRFLYITTDNKEEAYDLEQELLDEFAGTDKLLNIATDARRSALGRDIYKLAKWTQQRKQKISIGRKGYKPLSSSIKKAIKTKSELYGHSTMFHDHVSKNTYIFDTAKEASIVTGIKISHIQRCLKKSDEGILVTRGGYSFQRVNVDTFQQWPILSPSEASKERIAYFNKLNSPDYGRNAQVVEMYNIHTGNIIEFSTISDCSKYSGIPHENLRFAMGVVKNGPSNLKILGDHIFRYKGSNKEWKDAVAIRKGNYYENNNRPY